MLVQRAACDEGNSHVPIRSHLAEVSEFFSSSREQLSKFFKTARTKFECHELACFTHYRLATHLIQAQNDVDITVRRLVGHAWRESLISHYGTPLKMNGRLSLPISPAMRAYLMSLSGTNCPDTEV